MKSYGSSQSCVSFGYAILEDSGRTVGIDSLTRESAKAHRFLCPHCHGKMYPTFGEKQLHHFRHNDGQCKYDSYLHAIAESVFIEEYQSCIEKGEPFVLEIQSSVDCTRPCMNKKDDTCRIQHNEVSYDLVTRYGEIQQEQRVLVQDHSRRPDILLTSQSGDQLWVEIWVTHECDEDKRKEGQILEIKISSEKDLEQFREHKIVLRRNDKGSALYNFDYQNDCGRLDGALLNSLNCVKFSDVYKRIPREPYRHLPPTTLAPSVSEKTDISSLEWVDLGLPSGTLWANVDCDETLPYCPARARYLGYLPSQQQAYELHQLCKRELSSDSKKLIVTGPNGNSILLSVKGIYWLSEYTNSRFFGQVFRVGTDTKLWVNDSDINNQNRIRLCKMRGE